MTNANEDTMNIIRGLVDKTREAKLALLADDRGAADVAIEEVDDYLQEAPGLHRVLYHALCAIAFYDIMELADASYMAEEERLIHDYADYVGGVVDSEQLDRLTEIEAKNNGWQATHNFLSDITWFGDDFYLIDGKGHAQNITPDWIARTAGDLIRDVRY